MIRKRIASRRCSGTPLEFLGPPPTDSGSPRSALSILALRTSRSIPVLVAAGVNAHRRGPWRRSASDSHSRSPWSASRSPPAALPSIPACCAPQAGSCSRHSAPFCSFPPSRISSRASDRRARQFQASIARAHRSMVCPGSFWWARCSAWCGARAWGRRSGRHDARKSGKRSRAILPHAPVRPRRRRALILLGSLLAVGLTRLRGRLLLAGRYGSALRPRDGLPRRPHRDQHRPGARSLDPRPLPAWLWRFLVWARELRTRSRRAAGRRAPDPVRCTAANSKVGARSAPPSARGPSSTHS